MHGRISAGFEIQTHMIDDHEYAAEPDVVARDLALLMVMAARRAKRAGAAQPAPAAQCSTGAGRPKR